MAHLFDRCSSLASLELNNFNTEKVEKMTGMFYDCESLEFLEISSFTSSSNRNISMFRNLPETGAIKVDDNFYDLIMGDIPEDWTINE